MSRYYCILRLDSNPELEYESHEALNERLSNTIQEWAEEQTKNGTMVDISWSWSEHINL